MFPPDFQTRIVDRLFESPDLYIPMVDEEKKAALIMHMTRETYSKSAFLDARTRRAVEETEYVPIQSVEQAYQKQNLSRRPLRFIFHPAFAGSTLLCRCLDHPGVCLPFKEPSMLQQISLDRRNSILWAKPDVGMVSIDLALALLSRSYDPMEAILIKPADVCINIARELLGYHPLSRAVFLNLSLEEFVVAMLKREERREFMRRNVPRAQFDLAVMNLSRDIDPKRLSDGEAAAFVWYGLMVYYLDILRDPGLQVRSLDAVTFYAKPRETLKALANFFDLRLSSTRIDDAVKEHVFVKDSKYPAVRMDASEKSAEDARLRDRLSRELDEARNWAERHTSALPIPVRLPCPLMQDAK